MLAPASPFLYIPRFPNPSHGNNRWLNSAFQLLICAVRRRGGLDARSPDVVHASELAVVLQRISEWADIRRMIKKGNTISQSHYDKFKESYLEAAGYDQSWMCDEQRMTDVHTALMS